MYYHLHILNEPYMVEGSRPRRSETSTQSADLYRQPEHLTIRLSAPASPTPPRFSSPPPCSMTSTPRHIFKLHLPPERPHNTPHNSSTFIQLCRHMPHDPQLASINHPQMRKKWAVSILKFPHKQPVGQQERLE